MTTEQYFVNFQSFAEDHDITIKESTLNKLAKRAVQLEKDQLDSDAIYDELLEVSPKDLQANEDYEELVSVMADFVYSEIDFDSSPSTDDEETEE